MATKAQYPRVLIILMVKVKAEDPVNLLIRSQFGDWPKECLAQIHATGDPPGHGEFCGRYYRLQPQDRFLGGLFRRLRDGVFEMVAMDAVKGQAKASPVGRLGRWAKLIKKRLGDWLIGSGLWEVIFHVRLSEPMSRFVDEFKPDLIYCQGYSLGFATLPLLISKRFKIPICFQTTDDWPSTTYARSPVGWLLRRRACELIHRAKVRLAFGEKMQREYLCRYGVPFEVTHHLDNSSRFPPVSDLGNKPYTIVYTGGLGHRRYEAIQDLLVAVREVPVLAKNVEIVAYTNGTPKDMPVELLQAPEVKFAPLPTHDQLPAVLAKATILLLPESFNAVRQAIEFSLSTKAHLFMMSGRPILVYGPPYSGTVDYAAREGWGLVVAERNVAKLKNALVEILTGGEPVQRLRRNACACIKRNHELAAGRGHFRILLEFAAHRG
jgi:glycosyltransferase involved in cell wall biosynthesis